MQKFIINGGKVLCGRVNVGGFKNAATPIIAATLLTNRRCILKNVPRIGDVLRMLEILKSLGSNYKWLDNHTLEIENRDIDIDKLDQNLVGEIRSSVLLVGPLLARFGRIHIAPPGGCRIGVRSISTHLKAFSDIGVRVEYDVKSGGYFLSIEQDISREVVLGEFSVTATENLLMLGSKYPLSLHLAATEPHVIDLSKFLIKLGVSIKKEDHTFHVQPVAENAVQNSIEHSIMNDPIEAITFAILGAATRSHLQIFGVDASAVQAPLYKLGEFGVAMRFKEDYLEIDGSKSTLRSAKIQTLPYPGLPTDLQAPFGVLATQAQGSSLIFDTLYEGRLKYLDELKKMGADISILDVHRAIVRGPTVLHGAEIESLDLRAGATLLIAGLVASGKTELGGVEQIDRGYENLDGRLRELGADIKRN